LINDDFILRQAELFANRVSEATGHDHGAQVDLAYRIALSRSPNDEERALALDYVSKRSLAGFTHVLLNLNEFLYLR
jgi:hypothetical protein